MHVRSDRRNQWKTPYFPETMIESMFYKIEADKKRLLKKEFASICTLQSFVVLRGWAKSPSPQRIICVAPYTKTVISKESVNNFPMGMFTA